MIGKNSLTELATDVKALKLSFFAKRNLSKGFPVQTRIYYLTLFDTSAIIQKYGTCRAIVSCKEVDLILKERDTYAIYFKQDIKMKSDLSYSQPPHVLDFCYFKTSRYIWWSV